MVIVVLAADAAALLSVAVTDEIVPANVIAADAETTTGSADVLHVTV
jgi:hypothetical protein